MKIFFENICDITNDDVNKITKSFEIYDYIHVYDDGIVVLGNSSTEIGNGIDLFVDGKPFSKMNDDAYKTFRELIKRAMSEKRNISVKSEKHITNCFSTEKREEYGYLKIELL